MDNSINLFYIGNSIENIEHLSKVAAISPVVAENAMKAINYLTSGLSIHAILCEDHVPGGDGFSMHDWLRKRPEFSAVPFILVSDNFREDLYKSAKNKGIDDLYFSPLPPGEDIKMRIDFLIDYRNKLTQQVPVRVNSVAYKMPLSKRLFDITIAAFTLALISPFLLLVMMAIRLESKGKVYYISKRVGRKPFDFYKFRSMRVGSDAELNKLAKEKNQYNLSSGKNEIDFSIPCPRCTELNEGETCSPVLHISNKHICDYWYTRQKKEIARSRSAFIKISNDPRITRVGKFIRNTSIDELPQLINILKGDMSIVGNRPLPVYEAELLTIDDMSKRFLAPPGLTGLWQVELRGRGGEMSEDERKRLDNEYAEHFIGNNYSFWYDLKLILRTIPALLQKDTV